YEQHSAALVPRFRGLGERRPVRSLAGAAAPGLLRLRFPRIPLGLRSPLPIAHGAHLRRGPGGTGATVRTETGDLGGTFGGSTAHPGTAARPGFPSRSATARPDVHGSSF